MTVEAAPRAAGPLVRFQTLLRTFEWSAGALEAGGGVPAEERGPRPGIETVESGAVQTDGICVAFHVGVVGGEQAHLRQASDDVEGVDVTEAGQGGDADVALEHHRARGLPGPVAQRRRR